MCRANSSNSPSLSGSATLVSARTFAYDSSPQANASWISGNSSNWRATRTCSRAARGLSAQRQASQIDQIASGRTRGTITNSEAGHLLGDQARIAGRRDLPGALNNSVTNLSQNRAQQDITRHSKPGTQLDLHSLPRTLGPGIQKPFTLGPSIQKPFDLEPRLQKPLTLGPSIQKPLTLEPRMVKPHLLDLSTTMAGTANK